MEFYSICMALDWVEQTKQRKILICSDLASVVYRLKFCPVNAETYYYG